MGVPREGRVGRGGVGLLVREGYDVKLLGTRVGGEGLEQDNGVEIMWVRLGRKTHADVLVGVVYITPHGLSKSSFDESSIID